MKQQINKGDFRAAFARMGRKKNFTYEGLGALFDQLEQYEEDAGIELELDVIAFCCEYTEYENLAEFQANHNDDYETIEDIENETQVIMVDDESFIIQQF